MAKLTQLHYGDNAKLNIKRRQLPINVGDNLKMLMDLNSKGLVIDCAKIEGCELREFSRKFHILDKNELRESLIIDRAQFSNILNQSIACISCRKRVERLYDQLAESGHLAVDPLYIDKALRLSVREDKLASPLTLGTLLCHHHEVLGALTDNKLRNKLRCAVHSLDSFRTKMFSEIWREVFSAMSASCQSELTSIEMAELHGVLEGYLKKHKFCSGCRSKIEKAYKILIGEDAPDEKGYVSSLYSSIFKCAVEKHFHISSINIEFLDSLIKRAEPEMNCTFSKLRERHAKTMEVAQEEVLTCIGMILYERFRRVHITLREEERACQVLAAVGVHALCRNFNTCVEEKQGVSNLELFCEEVSRSEKAKEQRREQKKLRKKQKKIEMRNAIYLKVDEQEQHEDTDHEVHDLHEKSLLWKKDRVDTNECNLDNVCIDPVLNNKERSNDDCNSVCVDHNCLGSVDNKEDDEPFIPISSQGRKLKDSISAVEKTARKSKKKKTKKQCTEFVLDKKANINTESEALHGSFYCSADKLIDSSQECEDCHLSSPAKPCVCDQDVRDSGYGSDQNCRVQSPLLSERSSPVASVACSCDGICNDQYSEKIIMANDCFDAFEDLKEESDCTYSTSLIEEWHRLRSGDREQPEENDEVFNIPQEDITNYISNLAIDRKELYEQCIKLRENFDRFCAQKGLSMLK